MKASAFVVVSALAGASGVGLGAFGAHGLRDRTGPELLAIWDTASRYHLVHALAILGAAWAVDRWPGAWAAASGWLFLGGIVVFSGSLYALVVTGQRWLGAITPIGGVSFILGWLALAVAAARGR